MSRSVCPWCQNPYVENEDGVLVCKNTDCRACAEEFLHEEIKRLKKENELLKTQGFGAMTNDYTVIKYDKLCELLKAQDELLGLKGLKPFQN